MDIGKEEQETVTVEPIEDPVPKREPSSAPPDEDREVAPERERAPEREPALVPSRAASACRQKAYRMRANA